MSFYYQLPYRYAMGKPNQLLAATYAPNEGHKRPFEKCKVRMSEEIDAAKDRAVSEILERRRLRSVR